MGQPFVIAVFDTNIVIDALNGIAKADKEYALYERVIISRITWMEILVGEKGDNRQLRDFLENQFEIANIDLNISEVAVQLRRQYRIRLPDAIIWATAKAHNAVLVTRNTKDFDSKWDDIRIPYEI
ncbi:MAG: type II toxin-antitoxin system VapC family toxin [Anaerolineae bacterium]|nr:type II toxin-antitoxin system VapC family toxin [Anaerolineae bacterium]